MLGAYLCEVLWYNICVALLRSDFWFDIHETGVSRIGSFHLYKLFSTYLAFWAERSLDNYHLPDFHIKRNGFSAEERFRQERHIPLIPGKPYRNKH